MRVSGICRAIMGANDKEYVRSLDAHIFWYWTQGCMEYH